MQMRSSCPFMVCCICMNLGTANTVLLGKPKITAFWNCYWSSNCSTSCFIFHITLAHSGIWMPGNWDDKMVIAVASALLLCMSVMVKRFSFPHGQWLVIPQNSWQYQNASQYQFNNNITIMTITFILKLRDYLFLFKTKILHYNLIIHTQVELLNIKNNILHYL